MVTRRNHLVYCTDLEEEGLGVSASMQAAWILIPSLGLKTTAETLSQVLLSPVFISFLICKLWTRIAVRIKCENPGKALRVRVLAHNIDKIVVLYCFLRINGGETPT